MKKLLTVALSVVATIVAFCFAGCKFQNYDLVVSNDGTTEAVVFKISSDVLTLSDDTSVYDYLLAINDTEDLQIVCENGSYGMVIVSVNGVANNTAADYTSGYSWMLYTDLTVYEGVTYSNAEFGVYEYGELTLNSASYGISGLPAIEGYTFALVYSHWSY